ncbi:MAG: NOB1 family endonuclease [Candidatus Bathyarchaeota archaeon]|nr:MAG: NOB1 family endonuclease [Candidatus Bathyarchaeota archaeon]
MGYDPLLINENQYTTPSIMHELEYETTVSLRFKVAVETGKIILKYPSEKFLKQIVKLASKIGDLLSLSDVDKEVLALALELSERAHSPIIVSDDYSVQNVADQLNIKYVSLTNLGIRYRFHWVLYCSGCHRKFPPTHSQKKCSTCGTTLKRRVDKKTPSRQND